MPENEAFVFSQWKEEKQFHWRFIMVEHKLSSMFLAEKFPEAATEKHSGMELCTWERNSSWEFMQKSEIQAKRGKKSKASVSITYWNCKIPMQNRGDAYAAIGRGLSPAVTNLWKANWMRRQRITSQAHSVWFSEWWPRDWKTSTSSSRSITSILHMSLCEWRWP